MSDPLPLHDPSRRPAGLPPRGPGRWWRTAVAVPAFLVMLLAAYGLVRGMAQALAPVDAWLESRIVRPAAGHGAPGRAEDAAGMVGGARQDGP